jgi:integrase
MSRALTVRTLETLKPGPARKEIPDKLLPALYFILQPTGRAAWAVRYRIGRRSRKHTIGPYPAIDLKTARELGAKALRAVAEGRDPSAEKALARTALPDTFETVARQFVELHCRRLNRPRTIEAYEQQFRTYLIPRWGRRPISSITRRDVLDLLDEIVGSGRPIAANRVRSLLVALYGWSLTRDIVISSPVAGVRRPAAEQSRDRVLSDSELRSVWCAADKMAGPYGALIKLLILFGARRDEVGRMTWSELDFDARLWVLPKERSKNGRAHTIFLSDAALAVLAGLPRLGEFVLTVTGTAPINDRSHKKRRLGALLPPDMPHWTLHDLRRSVATRMIDLGVLPHVVEAVLNHVGHRSGVAGIYNRAAYGNEMRDAFGRWGNHVMALVAGT